MKTKVLFLGLFLLTFVLGIVVIPTVRKNFENTNSAKKAISINISESDKYIESKPLKNEVAKEIVENDIIGYETAKNFGGAEMLEEGFYEKEIKYKYELLHTGKFHGEEISAKSGENWLGLFKQKDGFYLASTKINVKRVYDEILDGSENEKTGKMVSVNNKIEPLFLIKNASKLNAGKVVTLFGIATVNEFHENSSSKELSVESPDDFTFKNKKYSLKVEKVLNSKAEIVYALILEMNETKQILNVSNEDFLGSLHWVGDLDQDDKLDFYISPFVKENLSESSLFLTSEAEKNNLVKKIALIVTSGC